MGYFDLKVKCSLCDEDTGLNRYRIADKGWICPSCIKKYNLNLTMPLRKMTPSQIKKHSVENRNNNTRTLSNNPKPQDTKSKEKSVDKLLIKGRCNGKKCAIELTDEDISITIFEYFGFNTYAYKSHLSQLQVTKHKKFTSKIILYINHKKEIIRLNLEYKTGDRPIIEKMIKDINSFLIEIQVKCKQCGNIHYYNSLDVNEAKYNKLLNISKNMLGAGGFLPLVFIPDKEVKLLNQCRKCASRNVELEEIVTKKSDFGGDYEKNI